MNILHLLSQNHLTGAEVYACQLIENQSAHKHTVFQLSNGFFHPTKAQKITLAVETKTSSEFSESLKFLIKFIKDNNIHVIHSHSRAAAKLAYAAVKSFKSPQGVGYVSTLHGRQHPSFSKKIRNIYGDFQIAICENIQSQLIHEFGYSPRHIKIIRNGISSDLFYPKKINSIKSKTEILKIALIGRATGPKKDRTVNFISEFSTILEKNKTPYEFHLIGALEDDFLDTQNKSKLTDIKNIFFHPRQNLHSGIYASFDLIVGAGRVCMEALMSGVPCIAFGESAYLGLCKSENIFEFIKSNFGDIAEKDFGSPAFNAQIAETDYQDYFKLSASLLLDLAKIAKHLFSAKDIASQMQRIYEQCYFHANYKSWIPTLMYHKIPDNNLESAHKIFVTADNFKKHLEFYKSRGFSTLTFADLKKFGQAEKPFSEFPKKPLILTFDDGYTDNLKNASPLLKQFNFKAQIFLLANSDVTHNFWDEENFEKADKIVTGLDRKKWLDSAFAIGSHGTNHQRLPQMSDTDALTELVNSKKMLEKEFNQDICVFAYTYGDTDDRCAKLAEKAGYHFAVNTDTGGLTLAENPYQIFRVNIFPDETYFSLWKKTSRWYRKYYFFKRKK